MAHIGAGVGEAPCPCKVLSNRIIEIINLSPRYSNPNKLECAPLCDVDMIVVDVKSVGVVITRSKKGDSDHCGWYFQVLGGSHGNATLAEKC
jgi:hypothetical protein